MMNKSLRARGRESSGGLEYGFRLLVIRHSGALANGERTRNPAPSTVSGFRVRAEEARPGMTGLKCRDECGQKKEPPFPAAFEVDNREASNRVDRSHSVSQQGRFKSYSRKLNRS
jgi:hypothetical protein